VGQNSEVPIRAVPSAHAAQADTNDSPQDFFWRRELAQRALKCFDFGSAGGVLDNLGVERQFVAKVIVDGSDVRSRSDTNLTNCGSTVSGSAKIRPATSRSLSRVGSDAVGLRFRFAVFRSSREGVLMIFKHKYKTVV
jgi:hypothetical protein